MASLLAFEATARFLSLSKAAAELNVTQPAISRQLKLLEQDLGAALYVRRSHGVELTPKGRELRDAISLGFNHVLLAAENIRGRSRGGIALGATVGFATFWLMPKLNRFSAQHSDVTLRLLATDNEADIADDTVDLAIRFGTGDWSGVEAIPFLDGEVFPVCSPRVLATCRVGTAEELLAAPLLEFSGIDLRWMPWPAWFNAAGMKAAAPRPRAHFNNYPLLIEAAIDGQGVALGWRYLLDGHLRRGELVRPIADSVRTPDAFWLVRPHARRPSVDADLLWRWLLEARLADTAGGERAPAQGARSPRG